MLRNLALAYPAHVRVCRMGSREHRDLLHASEPWPISAQHPCVIVCLLVPPPECKGSKHVRFDPCYILCDDIVTGI